MWREVKRVDLSNPPEVGKAWAGFLNPFQEQCQPCPSCSNGYSSVASVYSDQWYGKAPFDPVEYGAKPLSVDDETFKDSIRRKVEWSIELAKRDGRPDYYTDGGRISLESALRIEELRMFGYYKGQWSHHLIQADVDALVEAGRLHDLTSEWTKENGWQKRDGVVVTADQVNAWSLFGIGHDCLNQNICIKARCARNGEPYLCAVCNGSCESWPSDELKAQSEAWEPTEPPAGDGYQIWETVSEGSPVSPAFANPADLAAWMVANDRSVTKDNDFESWMRFIDVGWAPSGVIDSAGVHDGVQYVGSSNVAIVDG